MKLHEKIKLVIAREGSNLSAVHRKIRDLFEDNSIAYLTLYRTANGLTHVRESTLFQIASALGMSSEDIRKDTDEESRSIRYDYNKNAYLEVESNELNFLTGKLVLMGGTKTEVEQDPLEKGDFVKWVYGLGGKLTCVISTANGWEKHSIGKHESFAFKSTDPHYFENTTDRKATCLMIQNPKYL